MLVLPSNENKKLVKKEEEEKNSILASLTDLNGRGGGEIWREGPDQKISGEEAGPSISAKCKVERFRSLGEVTRETFQHEIPIGTRTVWLDIKRGTRRCPQLSKESAPRGLPLRLRNSNTSHASRCFRSNSFYTCIFVIRGFVLINSQVE